MEKLGIILFCIALVLCFIVAIFEFVIELLTSLFAGAGIYGIITVVCIVLIIVLLKVD